MTGAERVLVLAPHTDDAEFGCGGTIARLKMEGAHVRIIAFSDANQQDIRWECVCAAGKLGIEPNDLDIFEFTTRQFPSYRGRILDLLIDERDMFDPDLVLQPSSHDIHQDHQVICQEGLRAFKHTTIFGYELPWNNYTFTYQAYFLIDRVHVDRKISAVQCYTSQKHRAYADLAFIESQARVHGVSAGGIWAEAFEVLRAIL